MNRRGFLRGIVSAALALPIVGPAIAQTPLRRLAASSTDTKIVALWDKKFKEEFLQSFESPMDCYEADERDSPALDDDSQIS
jgi:hypothetical protein